ncbi:MAG TPA: endonuclease domain-containing protein [Lysobacter sp.]
MSFIVGSAGECGADDAPGKEGENGPEVMPLPRLRRTVRVMRRSVLCGVRFIVLQRAIYQLPPLLAAKSVERMRRCPTAIRLDGWKACLPSTGIRRDARRAKLGIARALRRDMSDSERCLWKHIRQRQVCGCKFRRQVAIGPYVVDFACLEKRLVVEVDGGQHCDSRTDPLRDGYLRSRGFRVLRFWNHDVIGNIEGVVLVIAKMLAI